MPHHNRVPSTRIPPSQIREDIERYAQLHSWYRHLSPRGQPFYILFRLGQQPRNDLDPQVQDSTHLHCWLIPQAVYDLHADKFDLPTICRDTPVIFTRDLGAGPTSQPQIEAAIKTGIHLAAELKLLEPDVAMKPTTELDSVRT